MIDIVDDLMDIVDTWICLVDNVIKMSFKYLRISLFGLALSVLDKAPSPLPECFQRPYAGDVADEVRVLPTLRATEVYNPSY